MSSKNGTYTIKNQPQVMNIIEIQQAKEALDNAVQEGVRVVATPYGIRHVSIEELKNDPKYNPKLSKSS
jgi:stage III sporulation protein SpoIIIAA